METEEVVYIPFNLVNLWVAIESIPDINQEIHEHLRVARESFEKKPKVYGKEDGVRIREVDPSK